MQNNESYFMNRHGKKHNVPNFITDIVIDDELTF